MPLRRAFEAAVPASRTGGRAGVPVRSRQQAGDVVLVLGKITPLQGTPSTLETGRCRKNYDRRQRNDDVV